MKNLVPGLEDQGAFQDNEGLIRIRMQMTRVTAGHYADSNHVVIECGDGFVVIAALDWI